jgi:hypothetical protein
MLTVAVRGGCAARSQRTSARSLITCLVGECDAGDEEKKNCYGERFANRHPGHVHSRALTAILVNHNEVTTM